MAITTAMTTSFKRECFEALHNFLLTGGNTFNAILIAGTTGNYDATTTNYSDVTGNSDEATGTGYSAGGQALTRIDPAISGTTAYNDFADLTWSSSTISAIGAMIYNATNGNRAVSVHDFGGTQASSNGNFTLVFPAAAASTAILRFA